ncbi:MAB_1171c family putative transporter [Nocardia brasiliensis]|uniref:MAB_1171c family putative transporter n=1 Tax=Nocardia brasiliensis TaxID=37326 RepID=UPI0018937E0C|nr:MAB_1171c family putative transporter [Nocardia brasiliensis]MBF6125131.1 hypothetical protein [Nocardia brasiliensis]
MDSAPPLFTALVVALVAAIVGGRWVLVNDTIPDRLINRALTWNIGAVVGYALFASAGVGHFALRVFMSVGFLALSHTLGFVILLNGAELAATWRRQRRYNAVAVSAGLLGMFGAAAEHAELLSAPTLDWDALLWFGVDVCLIAIAILLGRACLRELRATAATPREKLTYWALLVVACYTTAASTYRTLHTLSGASPEQMGTAWAVASFVTLTIVALLISIPLVNAVLMRAGLDREGRHCRRLRPLWHDLTTAVPEVVLPLHDGNRAGSSARLYRMTVEIRDALLHLKQFVPDPAVTETGDLGVYARGIAEATHLKLRGTPPSSPRPTVQLPADDQASELRNLLALSREWQAAMASRTA